LLIASWFAGSFNEFAQLINSATCSFDRRTH